MALAQAKDIAHMQMEVSNIFFCSDCNFRSEFGFGVRIVLHLLTINLKNFSSDGTSKANGVTNNKHDPQHH